MRRTTVLIPEELDERLRQAAARRGATISEVTREALEQHLGQRRLASRAAGRSGRSDVSARIDELLSKELGGAAPR